MSLIKENEELILNALHKDLAKVQDCAHVNTRHFFHTFNTQLRNQITRANSQC